MKIVRYDYKKAYTKCGNAIAIGNFDGLHLGHREIIKTLLNSAKAGGLSSCIYTFEKHPSLFFGGTPELIYDNDIKSEKLDNLGVDTLFLEDFPEVCNLSAEEFVCRVLIEKLNMKAVIVGENNRFGKNSSGDAELLKRLGEKYGFYTQIVKPLYINDVLCSSTEIRAFIKNGHLKEASEMLGENFRICGTVENGKHLGHSLGFPTANISPKSGMIIPQHSVYATFAIVNEKKYASVTNVGPCPTVRTETVRIETHILDFNEDIYGKNIEIEFISKMRDLHDFKTIDLLKAQLIQDIKNRRNIQ